MQAELNATAAKSAALESEAAAERPELRARLVEVYKLGQARYLRLLLATPDLRRIGQATRVVAAMAKLDRDRVAAHKRTLADLQTTRTALETHSREAVAVPRDPRPRRESAAAHAEQARDDLIKRDRSEARPQRAVDRRADVRAAEAPGHIEGDRERHHAGDGGVAAAAAVPRRPRLAGGARPRQPSLPARGSASSGIEIAAAEGRRRPGRARRRRRVRGTVLRLREPRHRRSRRADASVFTAICWRPAWPRARASSAARRWAPWGPRPPGRRGCISNCASTVSRSIPYNG